jgi:catechol-2,3-dioxygenase
MSQALAPTPKLRHVNLKTRRLDEMIAWYGMTVGMRVQHRFRVGWRL